MWYKIHLLQSIAMSVLLVQCRAQALQRFVIYSLLVHRCCCWFGISLAECSPGKEVVYGNCRFLVHCWCCHQCWCQGLGHALHWTCAAGFRCWFCQPVSKLLSPPRNSLYLAFVCSKCCSLNRSQLLHFCFELLCLRQLRRLRHFIVLTSISAASANFVPCYIPLWIAAYPAACLQQGKPGYTSKLLFI